jgi:hypothetical protein
MTAVITRRIILTIAGQTTNRQPKNGENNEAKEKDRSMSAAEALASLQAEMAALVSERNRLRAGLQGIFAQTAKHSRQWGQAEGAGAFASDPDTAKAFANARAALKEPGK